MGFINKSIENDIHLFDKMCIDHVNFINEYHLKRGPILPLEDKDRITFRTEFISNMKYPNLMIPIFDGEFSKFHYNDHKKAYLASSDLSVIMNSLKLILEVNNKKTYWLTGLYLTHDLKKEVLLYVKI